VIVRVLDEVYDAIQEAALYSIQRFGIDAAEKLSNRLFESLKQTTQRDGIPVLDLPRNFRYFVIKPYRLFFYRDEQAGEALVYLLRHTARAPLPSKEHRRLADTARRKAQPINQNGH